MHQEWTCSIDRFDPRGFSPSTTTNIHSACHCQAGAKYIINFSFDIPGAGIYVQGPEHGLTTLQSQFPGLFWGMFNGRCVEHWWLSSLWVQRGCGTSRGQTRLREDANTSRNVAASDATRADATTRRREHKSQRRSVRRDYAKTPPKLATSQRRSVRRDNGRRDYAKTRTQVATSQCQTRLREDAVQTGNVAASQHQTRQKQTRLREDANTSRNVAASGATTRRRRPNSQRCSVAASHSVRRDRGRRDYAKTQTKVATSQRQTRLYAKTPPKLATSQRLSVAVTDATEADATTRGREHKSQRRNIAASDATTRRRRPNSQRRSVRRDGGRRDYAKIVFGPFCGSKWWTSPWNPGVSPAPDRLSCRCHFIISTPKQSSCLIGVSCLFLVGGLEHVLFSIIYGMSSFPLTNSYFSRWVKPPTRFFPVKIIITTALIVPISWFVAGSLSRTNVADLGSASQ